MYLPRILFRNRISCLSVASSLRHLSTKVEDFKAVKSLAPSREFIQSCAKRGFNDKLSRLIAEIEVSSTSLWDIDI